MDRTGPWEDRQGSQRDGEGRKALGQPWGRGTTLERETGRNPRSHFGPVMAPGAPLSRARPHFSPEPVTAVGGSRNRIRPALSSDRGPGVQAAPVAATVAPRGARHAGEGGAAFPAPGALPPAPPLVSPTGAATSGFRGAATSGFRAPSHSLPGDGGRCPGRAPGEGLSLSFRAASRGSLGRIGCQQVTPSAGRPEPSGLSQLPWSAPSSSGR